MTDDLDSHMKAFNEDWAADIAAGQSVVADDVRALVDGLKIAERLTVELGRIERATTRESLNLARGRTDAFLSCALYYDDLKGANDWKLLARHIDNRVDTRRIDI